MTDDATPTRTITISEADAEAIDRLMAEGRVGSAAEVVGAGIDVVSDDETYFGPSDEWIRREVLPVLDEMDRDPSQLLTIEQVRSDLERRRSERRDAERSARDAAE